jgi:pyruvate/2-oxoglutarate/acetoin dehydrogenase E1 component
MRKLTYAEAINETLEQLIEEDERVVLVGQGVNSPWYVGSTTKGLMERFGEKRLIDTPVSENAVTGIAVGAAVAGMRPILEHPRMDFMYLAMDQIANHAANWHFMFGGKVSIPLTIWGIINRGGEQAAQHSQALHSMFTHVPGLKVVMPSTPHDAKGLFVSCVRDDNPVLFVDDRWLYDIEGDVPEKLFTVPIGKAAVRREGRDVSVIATSYMVHVAMKAAQAASDEKSVEVVDLRSLKPIDEDTVFESVRKTGRVVIVDGSWKTCGISAELSSLISEHVFDFLKAPIKRVALPDTPAPASTVLERVYYPDENAVLSAIEAIL